MRHTNYTFVHVAVLRPGRLVRYVILILNPRLRTLTLRVIQGCRAGTLTTLSLYLKPSRRFSPPGKSPQLKISSHDPNTAEGGRRAPTRYCTTRANDTCVTLASLHKGRRLSSGEGKGSGKREGKEKKKRRRKEKEGEKSEAGRPPSPAPGGLAPPRALGNLGEGGLALSGS